MVRTIVPKEELVRRDPSLRGKLSAPPADALPSGVTVHQTGDGLRVVTANIHMGVPDLWNQDPSVQNVLDPANENIDAIRDVGRFLRSVNADVVLVQELRDRPAIPGRPGVSEAASVLAHVMGASDMAFTPAVVRDPARDSHRFYGPAIYTRNGLKIDRAMNMPLSNHDPAVEARTACVAEVSVPGGRSLLVLGTHLANRPLEDAELRAEQLGDMTDFLARQGDRFSSVVVGGDFNQEQSATDPVLNAAGLTHVNDLLRETGGATAERLAAAEANTAARPPLPMREGWRIDHLYANGPVADVTVAPVLPRDYTAGYPTDHKAVVADFPMAPLSRGS